MRGRFVVGVFIRFYWLGILVGWVFRGVIILFGLVFGVNDELKLVGIGGMGGWGLV